MIRRFYVHNFRCLENFELPIAGKASVLLIGKNGVGKSTIGFALTVLHGIARGTNRVGQLVKPGDFSRGRSDVPMRFEIDLDLDGLLYQYALALEYPAGFKELRVQSEELRVDGQPIYSRELSQVSLVKTATAQAARFLVDWHMIALPIIQEQSETDPLFIFKRWLAHSLILSPLPSQISGESSGETLKPDREMRNLGAWFSGLIAHSPAVYSVIDAYLKGMMPDLWDIKNPLIGGDTRSLIVQFRDNTSSLTLPFAELSDGEKCIFISALVLASNRANGPIFCYWDEPDSHMSIEEVGHFIVALRRSFESGGQILIASHHPETIRRFSNENTLLLTRRSHFEPTQVRLLDTVKQPDDIIDLLIRDGLEP